MRTWQKGGHVGWVWELRTLQSISNRSETTHRELYLQLYTASALRLLVLNPTGNLLTPPHAMNHDVSLICDRHDDWYYSRLFWRRSSHGFLTRSGSWASSYEEQVNNKAQDDPWQKYCGFMPTAKRNKGEVTCRLTSADFISRGIHSSIKAHSYSFVCEETE